MNQLFLVQSSNSCQWKTVVTFTVGSAEPCGEREVATRIAQCLDTLRSPCDLAGLDNVRIYIYIIGKLHIGKCNLLNMWLCMFQSFFCSQNCFCT